MNCASHKMDSKPPFEVISATYLNWTGGVRGVQGTNINITYKATDEITFESIFYKNRQTKVSYKEFNGNTSILGQFQNKTDHRLKNLVMEGDAKKEFGNKPTEKMEKLPFELKDTEAAVSYIYKGTKKYFKITNLSEEKPARRIQ